MSNLLEYITEKMYFEIYQSLVKYDDYIHMERIKDFINYHRYEIRRAAQELIEDNPDEVMDPSDDLIREYCFVNPITLDLYIGGRLYSHQWLLD